MFKDEGISEINAAGNIKWELKKKKKNSRVKQFESISAIQQKVT